MDQAEDLLQMLCFLAIPNIHNIHIMQEEDDQTFHHNVEEDEIMAGIMETQNHNAKYVTKYATLLLNVSTSSTKNFKPQLTLPTINS